MAKRVHVQVNPLVGVHYDARVDGRQKEVVCFQCHLPAIDANSVVAANYYGLFGLNSQVFVNRRSNHFNIFDPLGHGQCFDVRQWNVTEIEWEQSLSLVRQITNFETLWCNYLNAIRVQLEFGVRSTLQFNIARDRFESMNPVLGQQHPFNVCILVYDDTVRVECEKLESRHKSKFVNDDHVGDGRQY